MTFDGMPDASRRAFLANASQASLLGAFGWPALAFDDGVAAASGAGAAVYDLSWTKRLEKATDRALIDIPMPTEFPLQIAARILDNCDAAYGAGKHRAVIVLNIRTRAVAMALTQAMWTKYALGKDVGIKGRDGNAPAISESNPFLDLPEGGDAAYGYVTNLVQRGALAVVCDFAMGHMANRLAQRMNLAKDDVHRELAANLVPGAFLVPSGMFGLMKAQNLGCAYVPGGG